MWRFLNSIPRALKNYHGPRASVGVYVESDDKDQEKESQNVVAQIKPENCSCPFRNAQLRGTTVLWRLAGRRNHDHSSSGATGDQHEDNGKNEKDDYLHHWWNSCQKDFWAFFQGPNRILETLAVGSSFIWSPLKKKGQKYDIVHQVLFSIYGKDTIVKTINSQNEAITELPKSVGQTLLAIKDASGSEKDRIVNELKCDQSLDAALKEFEQMCIDYTCQNESLLGIMASDNGDMSDAIKHFQTACSMGNKTACFNIGLCYEVGRGVPRNLEKAKHYYELAALKGHSQAMYNLSLLYLNTDGLVEGRGDRDKGMEWMGMAAKAGLVQAQKYMGVYYMEELNDAKKAVMYFRAASRQNDKEAQYFLALCHEHGLGVEVNECWAAHLYSSAASGGHDEAICCLARFTEHGLGGLPSNVAAAKELYNRAAKLGNEDAIKRVGELEREEEKAHLTAMNHLKDRQQTSTQPSSPPDRTLSSSSSSPDLTPLGHHSLSDLVYQRLWEFFQTCSDTRHRILFDPGGQVRFQIGGNDDDVACELSSSTSISTEVSDMPSKYSPLHKSSTTPDLSAVVACNI